MFPAYRYMDSHPQSFPNHGDHIAYPYHYYPSHEAFPSQAFTSTSKPPSTLRPWPHMSNIGNRMDECNGCCIHSHPPGYYSFRPPYPHIQPHPQCYYHGPYPSYQDAYPPYFVPPPHYPFEQARHDYDMTKNHCCGCPNHTCNGVDNKGVTIEEQNPEVEQKTKDSSSLIRSPGYPHSVIWVPPNYFSNREANKNSQEHPLLSNGWIPLDIDSLRSLMQSVDRKDKVLVDKNQLPWPFIWMPGHNNSDVASPENIEAASPQLRIPMKLPENENPGDKPGIMEDKVIADEKKNQLPWPFIWMPGHNKSDVSSPQIIEEASPQLRIPMKLPENENRGDKPGIMKNDLKPSGNPETVCGKESRTKTIPVKQVDERTEKTLNTTDKHKVKDGETKETEEDKRKTSANKQSAQAKTSKLPPICLRVDPLPRRKGTNVTSRSPSPPGHKDKGKAHQEKAEQESSLKETKDGILNKEIQVIDSNDKLLAGEGKDKSKDTGNKSLEESVTVVEKQHGNVNMDAEATDKVLEKKETNEGAQRNENENTKVDHGVHKIEGENINREVQASVSSEEKKMSRILSPLEAAILIQAAYRGFEVRRWQPLEKLRRLNSIRKQLEDVRKQIQDLEASTDLDEKRRLVIGETIMNLLLQLDTIQGLHQTVREARKAVTNELIHLQEKLDDLSQKLTHEHETLKEEESSDVTALSNIAVNGINSSIFEPKNEQECNQPTQDNFKLEATSVDRLEEKIEKDRHAEEVNTEAPGSVADTTETLAGEAILIYSKEDGETDHSNKDHESEIDKSIDVEVAREETSSDMESKTSLVSTIGKVLEAHTVSTGEGQSSEEVNTEAPGSIADTTETLAGEAISIYSREGGETDHSNKDHESEIDQQVAREKPSSDLESKTSLVSTTGKVLEAHTVSTDEGRSSHIECEQSLELEESAIPSAFATGDGLKEFCASEGMIPNKEFLDLVNQGLDSQFELVKDVLTESNASADVKPEAELGNILVPPVEGEIGEAAAIAVGPELSSEVADSVEPCLGQMQPDSEIKTPELKAENMVSEFSAVNDAVEVDNLPGFTAEVNTVTDKVSLVVPLEEATDRVKSPASTDGGNLVRDDGKAKLTQVVPGCKEEMKLMEQNEKLRETLETLLEAGKSHMGIIADLNERVKDLERKLSQKKIRAKRYRVRKSSSARKVAS